MGENGLAAMKKTTTCYADGCDEVIPRNMLMCRPHWRRVPARLRADVLEAYRGGSAGEWLDAAEAAKESLKPIAGERP